MNDNGIGQGHTGSSEFLAFDRTRHDGRVSKMKEIKADFDRYIHQGGTLGAGVIARPDFMEASDQLVFTKEQERVANEAKQAATEILQLFGKITLFLDQVGMEYKDMDKKMGEVIESAATNMGIKK